ncbi:hypothetical protein AMATHDRAFT_51027 [Amanita thiersii Skay4041]|uniref:Uncharacterized protein n=1 Tax=Amanita thiersii Skay4041 TaxID=703135 RepID=A0A2A9NE07_9AGAR|nr:hypothetical protein AMATHDRAFT_51027 [Amanita thiersii Skay4041]
MKGCLKHPSPVPSPPPFSPSSLTRKCVAFEADGSEKIFVADEWDRTPTEPTRKLTYQDLLELKEIQRSLPLANQPSDPILGTPERQYLSNVPIGLLPLLPQSDNTLNTTTNQPQRPPLTRTISSVSPTTNYNLGLTSLFFQRSLIASRSPSQSPSHSSSSSPQRTCQPPPPPNIAVAVAVAQRPKPNFAFLPLLDTPTPTPNSSTTPSELSTPLPSNSSSRSASPEPSDPIDPTESDCTDLTDLTSDTDASELDPPTPSLTNASLDSSPEPTFLQLPLVSSGRFNHYHGGDHGVKSRFAHFGPQDSYFSLYDGHNVDVDQRHHRPVLGKSQPHLNPLPTVKKPVRKRNVIVVNDMVIELDEGGDVDDEHDDEHDDECDKVNAVPALGVIGELDLDHRIPSLSIKNEPSPVLAKHGDCPTGFGSLHVPMSFKRREQGIYALHHS